MSDPELLLRNPVKPSFLTSFRRQGRKVQKSIYTLHDALGLNNEQTLSIAKHGAASVLEAPLQLLSHPQLRTETQKIAQREAWRVCALEMDTFFMKDAKGALLDAFQVGFESSEERLKNVSLKIVERALTDLALKGALDDILDCNIEKWGQSSFFMDVFARSAFTSPRFEWPVSKFIRRKVGKHAVKIEEAWRYPTSHLLISIHHCHRLKLPQTLKNIDIPRKIARWTWTWKKTNLAGTSTVTETKKSRLNRRVLWSVFLPSPPPSDNDYLHTRVSQEWKLQKPKPVVGELTLLQISEKNYATALDFRTYHLANRSLEYDEKVSSYIAKTAWKVE